VETLLQPINPQQIIPCIISMLKILIPELEQCLGPNAGKVENSPSRRFGHGVLSERKDKIRKEGSYENVDLLQYFGKQLNQCMACLGVNLQGMAEALNESQGDGNWGHRLMVICS
jgi:hypothetical protein